MSRRSTLGALVMAVLASTGCQRDVSNEAATSGPSVTNASTTNSPTTSPPGTTGSTTNSPTTSRPSTTGSATTGSTTPATTEGATTVVAADTTFPLVTTTVVGTAVAGNSGGVGSGETNSFSEAVRNADGTCSGWAGPGGETWTVGLETGAPVTFLADDDSIIGNGQIGTSSWEDVDSSDNEQWNCTFPFDGQLTGQHDTFRIQVAALAPWRARTDPGDPTRYVVSVDTTARFDVFSECTDPPTGLSEVSEFSVVGQFWANGIPSVCLSGLVVVDIERPCRPDEFASEHIIAVTRADDPSAVIEDAGGFTNAAELTVGTDVVVHVVTGRPCG